ncbi:hypothetical protein BGZ63DRAFT_409113 [Mariannaea sp. PMI_226]|nr:hypothetical protein BGZ63DRAFT_409113 [Mariannaea sp. PMI_226]
MSSSGELAQEAVTLTASALRWWCGSGGGGERGRAHASVAGIEFTGAHVKVRTVTDTRLLVQLCDWASRLQSGPLKVYSRVNLQQVHSMASHERNSPDLQGCQFWDCASSWPQLSAEFLPTTEYAQVPLAGINNSVEANFCARVRAYYLFFAFSFVTLSPLASCHAMSWHLIAWGGVHQEKGGRGKGKKKKEDPGDPSNTGKCLRYHTDGLDRAADRSVHVCTPRSQHQTIGSLVVA